MVNNIPLNGWPQLKDLEAVQPTLDRLDKIEAWKRTVKEETFTGDDITIENALALPARSLITSIEPIQDLHGYDKPWVGGADKNKLQNTLTTTTINGVTFTVNNDGTVTANGTATGAHAQFQIPFSGLAGDYYFDGCPSGGAENKYDIYVWDVTTNARVKQWDGTSSSVSDFDSATLKQIQLPSEHNFILAIRVFNGFTANNLVFKPMICASTETDPTFAPYSNICPVSGRTAATVTVSDGDEISEDFTIQLGQTVYGGSVDFTTGVASVTHAIVDMGDLEWDYQTLYTRFMSTDIASSVKLPTGVVNAISSAYRAVSSADVQNNNGTFGVSGSSGNLFVRDDRYTNASQFTTAVTGQTICYELATPVELTLTPTEVQMLKGYNRVTLSDGYGTIELKALTGANWS